MLRSSIHTTTRSFTITNDKQEMDDCGIARFTDLRFPQGTRLKMVRLQFAVEVQFAQFNGTACKALLETKEPSNPFIVMTNENQWESSEGILLKKDVFEGNIEVPWFMVCLHIHKFSNYKILTPLILVCKHFTSSLSQINKTRAI